MEYGNVEGKRVRLSDGMILDVTGGFAAGGSYFSDRKLYGDDAADGMGVQTRGFRIVQVLGDTPDDREHVYWVVRVPKGQTEVSPDGDEMYASVTAATAREAERAVLAYLGLEDGGYSLIIGYEHPAFGFEGDPGYMYHVLYHDPNEEDESDG